MKNLTNDPWSTRLRHGQSKKVRFYWTSYRPVKDIVKKLFLCFT
jgi:hypothetical protein